MNDRQLLNIPDVADKAAITEALHARLKTADFKDDIEDVLQCIHAYRRLSATVVQNVAETQEDEAVFELDEPINSPQDLIAIFEYLYSDTALRFNPLLWEKAVDQALSTHEPVLEDYCEPIICFLYEHLYVADEVIFMLRRKLPFQKVFTSDQWKARCEGDVLYSIIQSLFAYGDPELKLIIKNLPVTSFNSDQIDLIIGNLKRSMYYARHNDLVAAYNVVSENIPDHVWPPLLMQRELTILFQAFMVDKNEQAKEVFESVLQAAIASYPYDQQVLRMRAAYVFETQPPEIAASHIISILKVTPEHEKCLCLLGRCYLRMEHFDLAYTIFHHLKNMNRQNVLYDNYEAVALGQLIRANLNNKSFTENSQLYVDTIRLMAMRGLYEEMLALPLPDQENADMEALRRYAEELYRSTSRASMDGKQLHAAYRLARRKDIKHLITRKGVDFLHPDQMLAMRDFIFESYADFPDCDVVVLERGRYAYFVEKDIVLAFELFDKAASINPGNGNIYYVKAWSFRDQRRYDEAIKSILIYIGGNRLSVDAYIILSYSYLNSGNYYQAFKGFQWLISIRIDDDDKVDDHYFLLYALMQYISGTDQELHESQLVEDCREAIRLYEACDKTDGFYETKHGEQSLILAARISIFAGLWHKGLDFLTLLNKVVTQNGSDTDYMIPYYQGKCLKKLERFQEMIDILTTWVSALGQNISLSYSKYLAPASMDLAEAYTIMNETEEALKWKINAVTYHNSLPDVSRKWLERYTLEVFEQCLEVEDAENADVVGQLFMEGMGSSEVGIYVAHHLGLINEKTGIMRMAETFHRKCVMMSREFPEVHTRLVEQSRKFFD